METFDRERLELALDTLRILSEMEDACDSDRDALRRNPDSKPDMREMLPESGEPGDVGESGSASGTASDDCRASDFLPLRDDKLKPLARPLLRDPVSLVGSSVLSVVEPKISSDDIPPE